MAILRKTLRNLQDIRTNSGKVDRTATPYMAYMRITALEMEKARLRVELESVSTRINNIRLRLSEIAAEKGEILDRVGEDPPDPTPSPWGREEHRGEGKVRGFKLRY